MINCEVIKDLLPLYVDDALSEETKAIVKEHLSTCKECRAELARINHIPHSLQEPEAKGNYHYSGVVKKIRHKRIIEFTVGAILVAASCACIGKILYDEKKVN